VSATFVAISILGEPIGSALLALLLFGERFAPLQLAGFLLILGGSFLAARGEGESEAKRRERVFSEEQSDVRAQDHSHGDDPATGHDPRVP
jgi:hypothetical protein